MDFEAIAIVALLVLAAVPVTARLCTHGEVRLGAAFSLMWLIGVVGVTWYVRAEWGRESAAVIPDDRPVQTKMAGYVTSDTCRSCHPNEHRTWHASYHRSMTQLPTPTSVLGDFDDQTVTIRGHRFEFWKEGDDYWVEQDLIRSWSVDGVTPPRNRARVQLLTGSHHMQVYWTSTGHSRKIEQIPLVHLLAEDRWVPRDSVFLMPERSMDTESGRWNQTCVKCHSTFGESRLASHFDMDTRVAEFGIACEECHGPAEAHVAANLDPARRWSVRQSAAGDPTIVNPARLPARLQSHVCGQCHGVHHDRNDGKHNGYQPGDDLLVETPLVHLDSEETIAEYRRTRGDIYVNGKFWPDGMLRVSGREMNGLVKSPCFTHGDESKGLMSCLDCHNSHQAGDDSRDVKTWANDQLKAEAIGNAACVKCHPRFRDEKTLTGHTHHRAGSTGSQCYNCHMPHTSYGLLNAIRSHTLDSPDAKVSQSTGRPNACNQCHLDRTLAWTAGHLREWFGHEIPEFTEEEATVAESVRQIVAGDAAQRALAAWCMGWSDALDVSGRDWPAPYLAQLLDDPYDAVRYIAQRSLRRLPGFEDLEYDFIGPDEEQQRAARRAYERWQKRQTGQASPAVLQRGPGRLDQDRLADLRSRRDNKPIIIAE